MAPYLVCFSCPVAQPPGEREGGLLGVLCFHPRSVVYQQSSKESATLQPFFTLQLDIQSDKIRTVQDALESLVARESVQGYTTKTKQEVCSLSVWDVCPGALCGATGGARVWNEEKWVLPLLLRSVVEHVLD